MEYLLLIIGFVLLIKGADFFVQGSSSLARFLKIPSVIIGLTIVAMGTSAPEASVSINAYALEKGIPCWISMEERMACGVGACLACVCKSKDVDSHSHVHNKRVCKDGPVFLSTEVEL